MSFAPINDYDFLDSTEDLVLWNESVGEMDGVFDDGGSDSAGQHSLATMLFTAAPLTGL